MPLTTFDAQAKDPSVSPATVQTVDTSGTVKAGKTLETIYTTMQDTFDTEALSTAQVDYARGISELDAKYQSDTDYATASQRYAEDMKALRESMGEGLNRRVSEKFAPWAEMKGISSTTQFDATNRKKYRKHKLADGKDNEDFLSNSIVNAQGGQARGMAWADGAMFWESRKGLYDDELQWANAYEAWRDKTSMASMLSDLDRTGGLGFRPDPNISPEQNRIAQNYAQTLRNTALTQAEKQEKVVAKKLLAKQNGYEFRLFTSMSDPKPGDKPVTLASIALDLDFGRLSIDGANRLRNALTSPSGPTSLTGLTEAMDSYELLRREDITVDQYKEILTNLAVTNKIDQGKFESYMGKIKPLEDGYMKQAMGALSGIYYHTQADAHDRWRTDKARESAYVEKIYREKGGKAANDYVRGLAKSEAMKVGRPKGYTGKEGDVDQMAEYRKQVVMELTKFLADTGTEPNELPDDFDDKRKAKDMRSIINNIDVTIERSNELKRVYDD